MLRICFSIFILVFLKTANSQQPVFQWAKQFGSSVLDDTYNDNGRSIAVDAQGNVYSAGLFFNTIDFDPGPGVYNITAPGPFNEAIYISKLSPTGEFIWAKHLPVLLEGAVYMTLDKYANVYVTSELRQPTDMDPGPGIYIITPDGTKDAFVLKLDTNGNFLWVKQFGGDGGDRVTFGTAVTIDQDDNVIVCGGFNHVVDFDPGPNTFNLSAVGTFESFITKLHPNGDFIWAGKLGNFASIHHNIYIADVKCDQTGNIYTTGGFSGDCDFDPGVNNFNLITTGPGEAFMSKIDANGNFVWAKKIGNSSGNNVVQSEGIDVDGENNVYITGSFLGTQDFDPGNNEYNLTSAGSFDTYVVKLNTQGDFAWARHLGAGEGDNGIDIAVDNNSNVYTIGLFNRLVDFDPGPGVFLLDLYNVTVLSKFDANGNFVYASAFNRINDGLSIGRRLTTDLAQNIYITGYFGGTVDFDPGPGVYPLSEGRGWIDVFVLKLSGCKNITTSSININTCDSYTLNSKIYDTSGIYTQIIPNVSGCDSIITLNLTINRKFVEQIKTICKGESFYAGGASQNTSGIYKDTLQTISGCDSLVTTTLVVNPKPVADLGPDKNLCLNEQLTITPGSFTSYLWQDMSDLNDLTINSAGLYWVTVTNSNNCSSTDSLKINAIIQPPADFLKQTDSICLNGTLLIQPLNSFGDYLWSTGGTQSNITAEAPGQYSLRVADANGCYGTDTITLFPKECLRAVFIPTAFTPNRDGKNDFFKATVFGKVQSFKLQVFDRTGQLIFQTTDPHKQWNGLNKGEAYTAGTFVWQCFYQLEGEKPGFQKGTLTLIR